MGNWALQISFPLEWSWRNWRRVYHLILTPLYRPVRSLHNQVLRSHQVRIVSALTISVCTYVYSICLYSKRLSLLQRSQSPSWEWQRTRRLRSKRARGCQSKKWGHRHYYQLFWSLVLSANLWFLIFKPSSVKLQHLLTFLSALFLLSLFLLLVPCLLFSSADSQRRRDICAWEDDWQRRG